MARVAHLVALLAFDGVQLLDVAGPAEVFTTANGFGAAYDVRVISGTGADVTTSSGVRLGAGPAPDHPRRLGTLVVPGRSDWRAAVRDDASMALVHALAPRARRVASVCAGAFLLAEAGLLDGRRATTHWQLAGELARAYPAVRVDSDPVFARDGRVFTSAGVTAGIDLALALVEADHGAGIARQVARHLVVFLARPAGQSQFSARLSVRETEHPVLRAALDTVTGDPAADHTTDRLAARAGVSPRHLTRLFRTHTGLSPGRYVESIRVEAAQALLEGADSVEAVAAAAGFGSAETMRRVFHQHLGVSPTTYRARFRTTGTA
ncbi:GlxA family transcriptional regulator [Actinoplanes sp. L3-i22]|uniref:GlxA family transcriptional regulator n=1 Tax=Actinoplanes sp. L3-i22 TaxID=2836373 RepID=UPI001C753BE5|nr:GlxA family transcriptional regulator [Actinoplanes sp. L3-i22]BCY10627.1 AraC family transcriptional regulator [Actinoplanes sp. L3-i22]